MSLSEFYLFSQYILFIVHLMQIWALKCIFDLLFDELIINTDLYRFDRTLGGLEMEIRLRDHLAELFTKQKKTPNSVYDSPRSMAKLLKEAKRVKKVLSANADHYSQVGIHRAGHTYSGRLIIRLKKKKMHVSKLVRDGKTWPKCIF